MWNRQPATSELEEQLIDAVVDDGAGEASEGGLERLASTGAGEGPELADGEWLLDA